LWRILYAMTMYAVIVALVVILVALAAALAAAARRAPPRAAACSAVFSAEKGKYCVAAGGRRRCEQLPIPAIVHANLAARAAPPRCGAVEWGFGCDPGILCALHNAGTNLAGPAAVAAVFERCGQTTHRCGYL